METGESQGLWPMKKLWPERLLDISTMTSVSIAEGNKYGDIVEPKYGILSYTWGRYTVLSGPSLAVKGVSWPIPAIDEARLQVSTSSEKGWGEQQICLA